MPRLRLRRAPLWATVAAVALGAALASTCAGLLETAVRLDAPPKRLATAGVVVAAPEHATLAAGDGKPAQPVVLAERAPLRAGVAQAVAAVDGVARVRLVPDLRVLAVSARDGVHPATLKARIQRRVRDVAVLTGDARGRAETAGFAGTRLALVILASVFGGVALMVMAIVLASVVGLSIEQVRREIGLLRTVGATPDQLRRALVRRTLRPAVLAAAGGALLGPWLAGALLAVLRDGGVVPATLVLGAGPLGVGAGALATVLAIRVSAGIGVRRAVRAPLAEALAGVDVRPGRMRRGLAALALAGAASCGVMTMFMPPQNAAAVGGSTALGGALACALVAPLLTERLAGRLSGLAARLGGVPGELAVANLRARAQRSAVLVIPALLVASVALANVYQQTTQADAMRDAYASNLRAGAPAVASKGWIERPVDGSHRIDPWPLLGADPSALAAKVASGSLRDLHGDAVALPAGAAKDLGIEPGRRIGLVLGDGAHVRLRVAALLDGDSRYGTIVLPRALLAAHTTTRQGFDDGLKADAWITFAVVAVIVAYAALALVNLLVAALSGRRREFALLRLAGATRAQLRRMLGAEALLVAAIGAILGTGVAIAGLVPLAIATAGSPLPTGPAWVFPGTLALLAALVLVPTYVVSHTTVLRQKQVSDADSF
jgi:putative ABC transport system permease protein